MSRLDVSVVNTSTWIDEYKLHDVISLRKEIKFLWTAKADNPE